MDLEGRRKELQKPLDSMQLLKKSKTQFQVSQKKLFDTILSEGMAEDFKILTVQEQKEFMNMVVNKQEMFGAENMRFMNMKDLEAEGFVKAPKTSLEEGSGLFSKISSGDPLIPDGQKLMAVYYPELGLFGTKGDAKHYAGAAALGQTIEELSKKNSKFIPWNFGKVPSFDSPLELLSMGSAEIEARYIASMKRVDGMTRKEIEGLVVSPGDGPLLNAILRKIAVDPDMAGVTIKMASEGGAVQKQIVKEITERLVSEGKISAADAAKMGPDAVYNVKLKELGTKIGKDLYKPTDHESESLIMAWIGGDKQTLGRMAVEHLPYKNGGYGAAYVERHLADKFDKIYNSAESIALRDEFRKLADSDGKVYLYRGWKIDQPKGAAPLDSYATTIEKAQQFIGKNRDAGVKLYKIDVDDIVVGFRDVGPGQHNEEIIVRAGARPIEAHLSATGKIAMQKAAASGTSTVTTKQVTTTTQEITTGASSKVLSQGELESMYIAQKQEAIDSLLNNGIPYASIATKTNTDAKIVEWYATTRQNGVQLADLMGDAGAFALNKIKTLEDAEKLLSPLNKPLILSANGMKNGEYILKSVAMDNEMTRQISTNFMSQSMMASKSAAVQEWMEIRYGPEGIGAELDILASKLGLVNNSLAGNAFINSFDFFARNMEEVGAITSHAGKQVTRVATNMINRVTKPIGEAMEAVSKDAAALVEFTTFYNVNAGLKGWRRINEEGYLVQRVQRLGTDGKMVEVEQAVKYKQPHSNNIGERATNEVEYRVVTPSVRRLLDEVQSHGEELRNLHNTINRIKGTPDISDIGLWIPAFNPVDKHIAYVHYADDSTKLLWARSQNELQDQVRSFKIHLAETGDKTTKVYTKNEQANWNILNGRLDPVNMERADKSLQKGGSTGAAIAKPDVSLLGEIVKGYEFYITSQVRNLADLSMHEVTDTLRRMSQWNKAEFEAQPLGVVQKWVQGPKDAASTVRNALLGNSSLHDHPAWNTINKSFETAVAMGMNAVSDVWKIVGSPIKSLVNKEGEINIANAKKIDYKKFNEELEQRGIIYPWKDLQEEQAKTLKYFDMERSTDQFKRIVYGSNALTATLALRFGEIAQPLVNAMSMPVLTSLQLYQKMPATFLGVQKETGSIWPMNAMADGIRHMHDPAKLAMNSRWEAAGIFKPIVSEATEAIKMTHSFDKGVVASIESAVDSNFVKIMSKPADYAESLTRKIAMNTGAALGKRLYPELDEVGITIFARDFMDKTLGNFHAAQRPVMFQGTLGVALGLFQTYMWTMGQQVYRHLELKNYKALMKSAMIQNTIFGSASLPGFEMVSNAIGDHFSDNNVDLTTGVYRAIPDKMADFVLYGLPSQLGPTFSTRGDISVRFPTNPKDIVSVNSAMQMYQALGEVKKGLEAPAPNMAQALGQAISLQSLSRPMARVAELGTGYSITKQQNTVQVPEEVWSFQGIAARVMSTRPLMEQKLRDADHLNRFYGAADRRNREEAMEHIKTSFRGADLSEEKVAKYADDYLRHGGTPTGWRSAVNTALATTNTPGSMVFAQKLKPNNPLNYMIDNLD
jgi:hypothetical protein